MAGKKSKKPASATDEIWQLFKKYVVDPHLDQLRQDMLTMIHEKGRQEAQRASEQGLSIEQICERRFPNWHTLSEEDRKAIIRSLTDIADKESTE
jgi:hypothetical protein